MFVLKSVDFVDMLTVENTSHLTKEKSWLVGRDQLAGQDQSG
jgi:hypothetical protein